MIKRIEAVRATINTDKFRYNLFFLYEEARKRCIGGDPRASILFRVLDTNPTTEQLEEAMAAYEQSISAAVLAAKPYVSTGMGRSCYSGGNYLPSGRHMAPTPRAFLRPSDRSAK